MPCMGGWNGGMEKGTIAHPGVGGGGPDVDGHVGGGRGALLGAHDRELQGADAHEAACGALERDGAAGRNGGAAGAAAAARVTYKKVKVGSGLLRRESTHPGCLQMGSSCECEGPV